MIILDERADFDTGSIQQELLVEIGDKAYGVLVNKGVKDFSVFASVLRDLADLIEKHEK